MSPQEQARIERERLLTQAMMEGYGDDLAEDVPSLVILTKSASRSGNPPIREENSRDWMEDYSGIDLDDFDD